MAAVATVATVEEMAAVEMVAEVRVAVVTAAAAMEVARAAAVRAVVATVGERIFMEQSRKFDEAPTLKTITPTLTITPALTIPPTLPLALALALPLPLPLTLTLTRPAFTPLLPRRVWRRRAPGRTTLTCSSSCAPRLPLSEGYFKNGAAC